MPRQRRVRQATGRHRKSTLRNTQNEYRAHRGLSSAQVDLRTLHQHEILTHDAAQAVLFRHQVDQLSMLDEVDNSEEEDDIEEEMDILDDSLFSSGIIREDLVHQEGIHFEVHNNARTQYKPPSHQTIDEFDDGSARSWTGWDNGQLRQIAEQFNMQGTIKLRGYNFTREEIFLFCSAKIYSGMNNLKLCNCLFGGCPKRWTYAVKWYVSFIERRYRHILNVVGLHREVGNFPRFARAIARKINMMKFYIHPETLGYM